MDRVVSTGASAAELVKFWDGAGLRVAHAKSGSVKLAPGLVSWRAAIEDVLKVAYAAQSESRFAATGWERIRWRTVPSAGALYPYEVVACVLGGGTYLWDVQAGELRPLGLPALAVEDLPAAGIAAATAPPPAALLLFLARPWLSMKKYSSRGYLYCHLDVGHVATNVAIYTAALGLAPTLHLRFSRPRLAAHLRLEGLCREPLALLAFTGAPPARLPPPGAAPAAAPGAPPNADDDSDVGGAPASGLAPPGPREIQNWQALRGILSFDCALQPRAHCAASGLLAPAAAPRDGDGEPKTLPLPPGRQPLTSPAECRAAILNRRSAKGFRPASLRLHQIGELLQALRPPGIPADCPAADAVRLGVRLAARTVEGLAGVFAYLPDRHALTRVAPQPGDPLAACMAQEIARHAAAFLILHAPVGDLVARRGYSALAELLFHAAQLGQRLHLAAARASGLGVTCIGGFDGERCALLANLPPGDEAVYVILLGAPDDSAFKHDRANVAFSHGLTTVED
jgi:SagB-type dehydrogenase family enzyme